MEIKGSTVETIYSTYRLLIISMAREQNYISYISKTALNLQETLQIMILISQQQAIFNREVMRCQPFQQVQINHDYCSQSQPKHE